MIVRAIATHHFRNLVEGPPLTLGPGLNVVSGANAQGKTNLLEALYLLSGQRSFRAARTEELIRFGEAMAWVRATAGADGLDHEVRLVLQPGGRRLRLDGKTCRGRRGLPRVVLFTPDDLTVPRGAPAARRQFLDRALAASWPGFDPLSRDYTRALGARNRVLREAPPETPRLLDAYDRQLAALGARLVVARRRFLRALRPSFTAAYARLAPGALADLRYEAPDALLEAGLELQPVAAALAARLAETRPRDLARRATGAGPQGHDLAFFIDARPARRFASQGQLRSLVLAFKIAEILAAGARRESLPLLLLDDVSSELDRDRSAHLYAYLEEIGCQRVVTTTRPEIPGPSKDRVDFHIVGGSLRPAAPPA